MSIKKWLGLEMRLISRSSVTIKNIISLLFFTVVIIINKALDSDINSYINIYAHLFFIGGFSLIYGQNYYAIHSSHFSIIVCGHNSLKPFLLGKVILLSLLSFFLLLVLCGIFYNKQSTWIYFAGYFLYASTYLTFLTLYFGCSNHCKINLNNRAFLANLDSTSRSQFTIGLFYFAPPSVLLLFNRFLKTNLLPSTLISAIGLVCLLFSFALFRVVLNKLRKEKYSLYNAYSN